ncbi:MAG: UvrD-helicase domain-containing protein [Planctomycetes bacterium]|nr:UvrD-helicase domain-containing protein [Planctomycetota bacterium]
MDDPSPAHDSILDPLNPAQREAATMTSGPLCVLAGAGTGKTRLITHRIAYMVREGTPGSSILAVTFTNKAAREMRDRVWRLVGRAGVWLSTFHSFCAAFLREEFPTIERSSAFSIYDDADGLALMKRVLQDMNLDPEVHRPRQVLSRIGRWKNRLVMPEQALDEETGAVDREAADAYRRYDNALTEANACDFDDLLVRALLLVRDNAEIAERWRRRVTHVLVDEFQDTNRVQYALVRALTREGHHLCVTGDQDQSIYSWRGAEPEQFDAFLEDHPEAGLVRLEQNYRSTGHILSAASSVIACNRNRIPKRLWTEAEDGEAVRVVSFRDDYEEADSIAKAVREFESEGYDRTSMAVFYRTNALSLPIERALLGDGIPYVVVGGLEFFARAEVKDLLAYLRFLANPADVVSLSRILNVPPRGIGKKTQQGVIEQARASGQQIGEFLRDADGFSAFPTRARKALTSFAKRLQELDGHTDLPVARFISTVLDLTTYADYWKAKATKAGSLDPYQNIGQFVTLAEEFDRVQGGSLPDFLAQVALLTDLDRTERKDEAVSLMTLHTSKGLEYDVVFLVGAEHGLLPHAMSMDTQHGLEEERRLFHVGVTRARRRLVITCAGARTRFGRAALASPSPFLDEIGLDGVEHYGDVGLRPGRDAEDAFDRDEEDNPLAHLRAGAPVWHPDYGAGTVVTLRGRGRGLDRKVVVNFENEGRRTLILRHSQLDVREDEVW